MPLNCNGANSVSCVKSNRDVDGLQKNSFISNFEENFKIKTIGFKGFSKLPAVLVERCDAPYLKPKKIISKEKKTKPAQNENFTCINSTEKILKCSVNVVKADLEKLKAALSKRPRNSDKTIKANCDNNITQDCSQVVVSHKNIFCISDLPAVRNGISSKHLDTNEISDRYIFQSTIKILAVNNNNKSNSENLNTLIDKNVYGNLSTTTKHKNDFRISKKSTEYSNKKKPRNLDVLPVHVKKTNIFEGLPVDNNQKKSTKHDKPVVLNGMNHLNFKNVDITSVHTDINTYEYLDSAEHNDKNITERLNTPVHKDTDTPQNLNVSKVHNNKKKCQNLDIPIVLNGIKNLNLKTENLPEVHSDIPSPKNADTEEQNDKHIPEMLNIPAEHTNISETLNNPAVNDDKDIPENMNTSADSQTLNNPAVNNDIINSENFDKPLVFNGVKVFLNDDLPTVNPNFNSYVNLVRADLKKLKAALSKKKKKRKHSHCPHRIKSKYHKSIFQYPDTPVIDSNGNISHFDTATDSDINSPRCSDASVVDTDTSISQNSDILDSYLNLYQDYRSKINTVMNPFQHSYTPIINSDPFQDYKASIVKSDVNVSPNYVTPIVDSTDVETSPDYEPSFVESAMNISLDSVMPIVDPDLNLSQYTSDTPIVGCDMNLSPYSDSSSYLDSDINISQYSHTPMVGPDVMINISQYAESSMLEPSINFAQDAEGLDSVMNIAQYAGTPTADFNTNFNTSRTPDVPLSRHDTDDSHDSDILMICASMNMVNLRCKICGKVFSNEKKLQYHEENKHMIIYKAKSNKPKKRVSFSDKVIIHEVSQYHRCRKCSTIFENYRSLKMHKKLKHKKRKCYICDYCSKKFVDRMFFKVHIKLHCDVCGKLLRNKKEYSNHRKKVCRVLKLRKCKKCRRRFYRSMDLKDHRYEHLNSCFVCDICKDRFQTKCGMAYHMSVLHFNHRPISLYTMRNLGPERLYLCNFCDQTSVDRDLIEKHVRLLPDLTNRAMTGYRDYYFCEHCLKKFETESDMLHHKWTHFLKSSDNSQVRPKSPLSNKNRGIKKIYNIYEKLPDYLQPKLVLEKLNVPEKMVKAAEPVAEVKSCERNNGNIKKPSVHPRPKKTIFSKHQCQTCGRYFSTNYCLNRHISTLHGDFENLRCRVCEETFEWPSLLKSHRCIRLKIPEMPYRDNRPETLFDNLQEITPSFDGLNINDDYFSSVDFDVPSVRHSKGYGSRFSNGGILPSPPSSASSSQLGSYGRYVPLHSLGYKVAMRPVPIEF